MKGYKAFNPDLTCRGMQYEVGKSYSMDGEPVLCERGFHFCETIRDCSSFYDLLGTDNRVCEVEASGTIRQGNNKCVTNRLFIVRELSQIEINRGLYVSSGNGDGNNYGYGYLSDGSGFGDGKCCFGDGFGDGSDDGYSDGEGCGFGYGESGGHGGSGCGCSGDGFGDGNGNDSNGNGFGDGDGNITRVLSSN